MENKLKGITMKTLTSEAIQAFPIERETQIGVLVDFDPTNYEVIHAMADGTITFEFGSDSKSINVKEGMDFAIGSGCTAITSTGEVLIS